MTLRTLTVRSCYCREGWWHSPTTGPKCTPICLPNPPWTTPAAQAGPMEVPAEEGWGDANSMVSWGSGKGPGAGAVQPTEEWAMVPVQAWRQTLGSEELKTSWHQASVHLPLPYQDFSNQGQAPPSRAAAGGLPGSTGLWSSIKGREKGRSLRVSVRAQKPPQQLQEEKGAGRSQTGGE